MSNTICWLLKQTSPNTPVKQLMINGKAIEEVEKFVKFDSLTGLAYFTKKSNDTFAVICETIGNIEFVSEI